MNTSIKTIDAYVDAAPAESRAQLKELRSLISKLVPDAKEAISYGLATFKLNGNLIHFGGYKEHIGLYPGAAPVEEFKDELKEYKTSKGTIQFPLGKPLPVELITRIVKSCEKRQRIKAKR